MNYKFLNTEKIKYISFVESGQIYIPIYSQPWWLEAVTNGDWDVIIVEESGRILACNPYYFIEHDDGIEIRKAPLSQNNGVLLNYQKDIKYTTKISNEREYLERFIKILETKKLHSYRQYFHHSFTNWLPFYWEGFSQTTRYTYIIYNQPMDRVMDNMSSKLRNQIKKAEKILKIVEGMPIADFYQFNKLTYDRQNMDIPYDFELVKRIDSVCAEKKCRRILCAVDNEGNYHAGIYLVEDEKTVYYILSASDQRFRNSNAQDLLLKEAISYAMSIGKDFDFEGSMKKNIEKNFSQFGAVQVQYMDIKKDYYGI
jgi:hypothetical protein